MKKKLTLFLACAALAGTLGGCSRESGTQTVPATTPETKEESRPETTPAPSQAEPSGTYTATAQGFGGDVTVTLTIKDDHLTAVDIQGENYDHDYKYGKREGETSRKPSEEEKRKGRRKCISCGGNPHVPGGSWGEA